MEVMVRQDKELLRPPLIQMTFRNFSFTNFEDLKKLEMKFLVLT